MRQTAQMFYLNITQIFTLSYWLFVQRLVYRDSGTFCGWKMRNFTSRNFTQMYLPKCPNILPEHCTRILCPIGYSGRACRYTKIRALSVNEKNIILIAIFHKNFPNCPNRNYTHSISLISFGQRLQENSGICYIEDSGGYKYRIFLYYLYL